MNQSRLFIAVSTGQKIANLPPILEHAEPGDEVLWIESDRAAAAGWTEPAAAVLRKAGLVVLPPLRVTDSDDPEQIQLACRNHVERARREHRAVFIVANGGKKLAPVGLLLAFYDLAPTILYGDDQPVACRTVRVGPNQRPDVQPYTRHRLDLEQVLAVSGHIIQDPARACRFWPGPPIPPNSKEFYGLDWDATAQLHRDAATWHQADADSDDVVYEELHDWLPDSRIDRWKRSFGPPQAYRSEQTYKSTFHATQNLIDEVRYIRARQGRQRPAAPIGESLERAARHRLHAWLESRQPTAIMSAWSTVKVAPQERPEQTVAEFDLLLVLRNGILWHLECKAATAQRKDLDARDLNLKRAGSQLARMAICLPLFTDFASEPWFAQLHALRQNLEQLQFPVIPFTRPGQPESYTIHSPDTPTKFSCPTFEKTLDKALTGYELDPDFALRP
jgi:hypothetical protein